MLPDQSKPSLPKNAVTPRHALLENLISVAVKHLSEQFHDFALSLAGALVDGDNMSGDVKEVQARIRAGNLLRTDHFAFMNLVSKEMERSVRRDLADLRPGKKAAPALDGPLSLVPFEEMDNKVTMGSIAKPFEVQYSDALATLNVRLAFLMDRDILRVNQNPFRPEAFLNAINAAWLEFVNDEEAKEFLMPHLKPDTFFELSAMYEALNQGLERKGEGKKMRRADSHDASMAPSRKKNQQAALAEQLRQFFAGASDTPSKTPTGFDQLGDLDLSLPTLAVAPGLYGAPGHLEGGVKTQPEHASAATGAAAHGGAAPAGVAAGVPMAGAAMQPAMVLAPGVAATPGAGVPMASGAGGVSGVAMAPGAAGIPGMTMAAGVPGVAMAPGAAGIPGAALSAGIAGVSGAGMAPGVGAVPGVPAALAGVVAGGAVAPGAVPAPGFVPVAGGAAPAGVVFAAPGASTEMMAGVAVPGVPGGVAVPATGWVQGPAQGFHGGANNEVAQRLSLISAKEPLMNYLAQLQRGAVRTGAAAVGAEGMSIAAGDAGMFGLAGLNGMAGAAGMVGIPAGEAGEGAAMAGGFADQPAQTGNVFFLPQIKQTAPQGSLTRADESTIDLLSAVFDTVFRDESISPEIKNLIRFLQIPVLKAALVDKDFFFQEAHPARRMIDLMSRMGWEQKKGSDDPLFKAMQKSVEKVGSDYEQELSVFTEAVNELEASLNAEETAAAAAIAEPIKLALKQEKMAVAAKSAKDAVALRIGTGEVVAVVEAFLENKWVSVLKIAYSVEDEKPGAVKNATDTMDDLIWSVRPKITADDRKKLIAKLPTLLSTLNKWLDVIKWQDSDRLQFFAELAECHASIVRAPLEISPERQVEIAMEVAQKDAERRLELQAKIESETPPPQDDDATIEVDSLARGNWLEFEQDDGSTRKVKLAWISPLKTLYIFSTSSRQEAFSISGDALAQQFRDGTVRLIRTEGVVAQALTVAMGAMAVNDDTHDQAGVA
ncbi:DUF1631 family protein [Pseudoduganella sp. RAF19]|uniref:DUF1631 family protein n=1 Tax=Pseudoduganella sp. RAF19 TaxID=3233052 RepID=UPI003F97ADDC